MEEMNRESCAWDDVCRIVTTLWK